MSGIATSSRVLVAIPAWNEEATIGTVVGDIKRLYPSVDVLVVDDGSHDRTAGIARDTGALLVQHPRNLGYTAAIQTGRSYAWERGYDVLVFADADGQHRPEDIGPIVGHIISGRADQVRGSRERGGYQCREPWHLRLPRYICALLVSLKLRQAITDPTSGFKGETRAVTGFFKRVYETTSKIHRSNTNDIEEILIAHKNRFRVGEVPAHMLPRAVGSTRCYTPRQLLDFPLDLVNSFARNF